MTNSSAPRSNARATTLPQRKAPVMQATRQQPFSVLQTGRAPAQLSLFLRPNINMR